MQKEQKEEVVVFLTVEVEMVVETVVEGEVEEEKENSETLVANSVQEISKLLFIKTLKFIRDRNNSRLSIKANIFCFYHFSHIQAGFRLTLENLEKWCFLKNLRETQGEKIKFSPNSGKRREFYFKFYSLDRNLLVYLIKSL